MQSRLMSFVEAVFNTAIGLLIAYFASAAICHVYDIPITSLSNLILTGWMTVVSVLRGFVLRRLFNGAKMWWTQWRCPCEYVVQGIEWDGECTLVCKYCEHTVREPLWP